MGGADLEILDVLGRFGEVLLGVGVGEGTFGRVDLWGRGCFWGVLALAIQLAELFLGLAREVLILDQSGLSVAVGGRKGVALDGARLTQSFFPPHLPSQVLH